MCIASSLISFTDIDEKLSPNKCVSTLQPDRSPWRSEIHQQSFVDYRSNSKLACFNFGFRQRNFNSTAADYWYPKSRSISRALGSNPVAFPTGCRFEMESKFNDFSQTSESEGFDGLRNQFGGEKPPVAHPITPTVNPKTHTSKKNLIMESLPKTRRDWAIAHNSRPDEFSAHS